MTIWGERGGESKMTQGFEIDDLYEQLLVNGHRRPKKLIPTRCHPQKNNPREKYYAQVMCE